jgi:hypothetical protein
MPVAVTHRRSARRRVDDVGEQHGGDHPIIGTVGLLAGEELGDPLKRLTPRFDEVENVAPRKLDVFAPDMRSAMSLAG